ncbi:MAG: Nif3-like dinuclear metal center hexameric protein [Armatimonadetes bacterium]|nr:Nif3-like dinuclear metal center hexameric protein [Armatimonadota bacterium]
MSLSLSRITAFLQEAVPEAYAEEWDNVGLQVGDPSQPISSALVTVDVTPAAFRAAQSRGAGLIVAHHPLIFKPLKRLDLSVPSGRLLGNLIRAGIAVYSLHTNYDAAPGGISHALAAAIGLEQVEPLAPSEQARLLKLAVFVPAEALEAVRTAMAEAGAGRIGNYAFCSYQADGTGTFLPLDDANPYSGERLALNHEPEARLEMLLPAHLTGKVVAAMLRAHPYEEVAYDLYPLENRSRGVGLGCIGQLPRPLSLKRFAAQAKKALGCRYMRVEGEEKPVRRVAVCGGSGRSLIGRASCAGADAFVTGDLGHHDRLHALELGLPVIDAGHHETELPGMKRLCEKLQNEFAGQAEFHLHQDVRL